MFCKYFLYFSLADMDPIVPLSFTAFLLSYVLWIIVFKQPDYNYFSESFFSTKTPYRYAEYKNTTAITFPDCQPFKTWMMIRHGTRTSKKQYQVSMQHLFVLRDTILERLDAENKGSENSIFYGLFQTSRRRLIVESLKIWNPDLYTNDGLKTLTSDGEREMFNLGERYFHRFKNIFSANYSNETFLFRYTNTQRTKVSAEFFAKGLFGEEVSKNIQYPKPLTIDPILRFYKKCPNWSENVKKGLKSKYERSRFKSGMIMGEMIQDLSDKLGMDYLPFDHVYLMYMTCCYEMAWLNESYSPWCILFTREELEIMEYYEDLQYYWVDGYGFDINYQMACGTFKDAYDHLISENNLTSVFYFTHSGTILKFLSHLGLYRDSDTLRSENFIDMGDRLWKTSKIDPFGTNIVLASYKCGEELKILTMHQEKPVIIPGCPTDTYLCPLSNIGKIFNQSLTNCNFDKICAID